MRATPDSTARPLADRLAVPLLAGHVALVVFSTAALTTFLAGPPPDWLSTPGNQLVLRAGWKFSGPMYVVLGALAALAHATARAGGRRAIALFVTATGIALASELIGTSTGYPFGPYSYTPLLGYLVGGRVPFPIPLSWFFMLYCSLAICGRLLQPRDDFRSRLVWSCATGAVLAAWDVAMDPAMSAATSHWVWTVKGSFYGMPLSNWLGWWLTGTAIAFMMLAIVPPSEIRRRISPSGFPLVLYATNGVMPVALCARHGLWWAVAWGTLAMAIPLALAMRAGVPRPPPAELARGATARA